ncbi:MAG: response regulator [Candidatus Sericytochromatia bacterium]|nr:response regulator [Candidatus Sericytochromatia bacterium]
MTTILLVEDVEDNRDLARLLLEMEGYEVVEAHNGQQAVAAVQARAFDLVLMDLSLPEMDGWEATRVVQGLPDRGSVPIVALTAHAMSGDRERVMAAGFSGYMSKPIDVGTFASQVRGFLQA